MNARLIYQNGVSTSVEGVCTVFPVPSSQFSPGCESIWEYVFDTTETGIITGIECEGLYSKSITPPLMKTENMTLTIQIKGGNIPIRVGYEIDLVEQTSAKDLPLIMHDLKTWTGKKLFEEKLKSV